MASQALVLACYISVVYSSALIQTPAALGLEAIQLTDAAKPEGSHSTVNKWTS